MSLVNQPYGITLATLAGIQTTERALAWNFTDGSSLNFPLPEQAVIATRTGTVNAAVQIGINGLSYTITIRARAWTPSGAGLVARGVIDSDVVVGSTVLQATLQFDVTKYDIVIITAQSDANTPTLRWSWNWQYV